jgi:hypothetical protein
MPAPHKCGSGEAICGSGDGGSCQIRPQYSLRKQAPLLVDSVADWCGPAAAGESEEEEGAGEVGGTSSREGIWQRFPSEPRLAH